MEGYNCSQTLGISRISLKLYKNVVPQFQRISSFSNKGPVQETYYILMPARTLVQLAARSVLRKLYFDELLEAGTHSFKFN